MVLSKQVPDHRRGQNTLRPGSARTSTAHHGAGPEHRVSLKPTRLVTAAFAALNWKAFTTPADLSLGVTSVNGPPWSGDAGFACGGHSPFFLLFVVVLQTSALLETRRQLEELRDDRDLADQAEASRFTELNTFLVGELNKQTNLTIDALNRTLARLHRLEGRLTDRRLASIDA